MVKIISKIFRIKSVDGIISDSQKNDNKLRRSITWVDLIFMGIGAVVGAGIFATIGTAAAGDATRPGAGPALMLSFVLTAVACGFSALCYAEFASLVPIAGSAYTYAYATLGEIFAWIIGWDLIIEYAIGNVAVAISWSGYFCELLSGFGIYLPEWLTMDFRTAMVKDSIRNNFFNLWTLPCSIDWPISGNIFSLFNSISAWFHTIDISHLSNYAHTKLPIINELTSIFNIAASKVAGCGFIYPELFRTDGIFDLAPRIFGIPIIFNLPAVGIITLLTIIITIGIKESSRVNEFMVIIKLLVLGLFCAVGIFYVQPANFVPFAPNGFSGIAAGAAIVFFAFIGFDAVSTLAEETRDPGHDLPIGIIGTLIVCTLIYVIVTFVFSGIIPYSKLTGLLASEKAEPLTVALHEIGARPMAGEFVKNLVHYTAGIVALGSVVAQTAVLLVFQIGQPRILFSMSRDGLLPKMFMAVHKKFQTPHVATIITGIFVGGFSAFMSLDEMVDLCNIGTLFAFMIVCAGIIVLQITDPKRHRPFKVPGGFIIPLLGIASCLFLSSGLPGITWLRFALWLVVGLVVYFLYGMKNSRLAKIAAGEKIDDHPVIEDIDKF